MLSLDALLGREVAVFSFVAGRPRYGLEMDEKLVLCYSLNWVENQQYSCNSDDIGQQRKLKAGWTMELAKLVLVHRI
jgi:hypothetical protein